MPCLLKENTPFCHTSSQIIKIAEQDIEKFTIREIINIDMGLFPHKRESSVTIDTKIDVNNSRIEFAPSYPQFYFCFFGKATPLCSSPFFFFYYMLNQQG